MSINKVILLARLGQDPELSHTTGGVAVCNFSVATSENWIDKTTKQKQEKTEWHNISVFGALAENANKYLAKGKQCYIEGSLQTRSWDDKKSGEKKYKTEIKAKNIQFLGGQDEAKQGSKPQENAPAQGFAADDIPF